MALPIGMLLSFFDLLGARAFARGEVNHSFSLHKAKTTLNAFLCSLTAGSSNPLPLPAGIPRSSSASTHLH
jgi:hypothetical protein